MLLRLPLCKVRGWHNFRALSRRPKRSPNARSAPLPHQSGLRRFYSTQPQAPSRDKLIEELVELRVCKTVGDTLRTEFTGLRTEFTGLRTEMANNSIALSTGLRTEMENNSIALSAKVAQSADALRKTMKDREVSTLVCEHSCCSTQPILFSRVHLREASS
jgi:hypothetical protein